jgi:hypothetical protein
VGRCDSELREVNSIPVNVLNDEAILTKTEELKKVVNKAKFCSGLERSVKIGTSVSSALPRDRCVLST